jgi:hypothetical protein
MIKVNEQKLVDVYTAQEVDTLIRPQPVIPSFVQLFGPRQGDGLSGPFGATWIFPGPVTASTKQFLFTILSKAIYANWLMVWTPRNMATRARLLACDFVNNGVPQNMVVLGEIPSNGSMSPVSVGFQFTAPFNELVAAKVNKYIGFQMIDDGVNFPTIYESRLELVF